MITAATHASMPTQCLVKINLKSISRKNLVLPVENFLFLPRKGYESVTTPNHPFFPLLSICQVAAYGRLNAKANFKLLIALNVVAVAYGRWSLKRGSKHTD